MWTLLFFSTVLEPFKLPMFAGSYRSPGHLLKSNGKTYRTGRQHPFQKTYESHLSYSSGDTGVTAFIVLHGTPPFQIYYTMRRDNEPAAELSKTITSSRYEMKLEPKSSGHYAFAFVAVSDANYRKVELSGPSIDKMIHPIASAEFSESQPSAYGRSKKIVSSCSGDTVDIDVDLRVSSVKDVAGLC